MVLMAFEAMVIDGRVDGNERVIKYICEKLKKRTQCGQVRGKRKAKKRREARGRVVTKSHGVFWCVRPQTKQTAYSREV
jgi:hypothetical protein